MYKMKEVCQMTGLTEKAIRIYMDQKLINPKVEEGVHRKAYFFSEEDVERLKDIATLRNAGFGIAEIKQMQESPEMLSLLIEEKKELLESEILQKQAIQDTLKNLTIQEHSDVTKLADAIEPRSTYAKETPKKKLSRKARWAVLIIIVSILFGWNGLASGKVGVWIFLMSFGLVFGIMAVLFGIRYLLYHVKMKKIGSRGSGKITAVVENENIEEFIGERERSIWKDILAYVTFGLFGEGIWNMLRPDAWYPVISYQTEDGAVHTATTRYGAFHNTWKVGDAVNLTWEDGKDRLVHVCGANVFQRKAYTYMLLGVVLLLVFGIGVFELFVKQDEMLTVSTDQRLEYPADADRVEMKSSQQSYELNEEEIEVLKKIFSESEVRSVDKYRSLGTDGTVAFYFYQGEKEILKYFTNHFFCVYTGEMRYYVYPSPLEFRGITIGDTEYITECWGDFALKVKERYAVEAIMESISEREELEELKNIINRTEYFTGARGGTRGYYEFFFSEQGFIDYFGREPKENELGKLEIFLQDGEFINAVLTSYCYTETGDVEEETYHKEW